MGKSWVYRRPPFRQPRRIVVFTVAVAGGAIKRAVTEDVEVHEEALSSMAFRRAVDDDLEIIEMPVVHHGRTLEETEEIEEEVFGVLGFTEAHDEVVEISEEVGFKFGQTTFASASFDSALAGPQATDDAQGGVQAVG